MNPVAVLLNKVVAEDVPRFGQKLCETFSAAAEEISVRVSRRIGRLFPAAGGLKTIGYLYARTILSEAPSGGAFPVEIPLIRSMWLGRRQSGGFALTWVRDDRGAIVTDVVTTGDGRKAVQPRLTVVRVTGQNKIADGGTTIGGSATCPITGFTTPVESVRRQLHARHGGANDARLLAVIYEEGGKKSYRDPNDADVAALVDARALLTDRESETPGTIPRGEINHLRGFINVVLYGISNWGDAFNARQILVMDEICSAVAEASSFVSGPDELVEATRRCLALAADRLADYNSALCTWRADGEFVGHTFSQGQALPMRLDYMEINPFAGSTGGWKSASQWVERVLGELSTAVLPMGQVMRAPAGALPLPDDSVDVVLTDPPYYAAVPYADLSDFFYTWLRRGLRNSLPELFSADLTPKSDELVSLAHRAAMYREKNGSWYEARMREACVEIRRVAKPQSVAVFVFANKETAAWEAMLAALVSAGWVITASWPIDTEMEARLRARNSAALASSIHIVCRPRETVDGQVDSSSVGEWREVLAELPRRIEHWMSRLADEGVVGADAIFACLGPALEIFSRYARVEKFSGELVALDEYLEHVWAAVARAALAMVLKSAETADLEPDARVTAIWLWTVAGGVPAPEENVGIDAEFTGVEDVDMHLQKTADTGFVLEYDAARKIAQGLGARLDELTHMVEVRSDKARLLPVVERTRHLFGKASAPIPRLAKAKRKQLGLFAEIDEAAAEQGWGELGAPEARNTTLDRVHQSMILFGAGRGEALRRFLIEEKVGDDPKFWKLAQSLSALYPANTDEKRWIDGVLARKKGLGFA